MTDGGAIELTPATLRRIPLPALDADGDKEERGRVLVAGGSRQNPGALVLAGVAALRAGAGKLRLATCASAALPLAVAVPEARVYPLAETEDGDVAQSAAARIAELAAEVDALLLGPGMVDADSAAAIARDVLSRLDPLPLVLDAGALGGSSGDTDGLRRAIVTPHAGEMAKILGCEKAEVTADPLSVARDAARRLGCVVALKGSRTYVAGPDGAAYAYAAGDVGLATSGSGDVLAGVVAGLLARGAEPIRAAAWGVWLHGEAGNALARSRRRVGALARELADEVPWLLEEATRPGE